MKNLFKEATFWELSNVLWWASVIVISVPAFVWYKLVKKPYYYIKNTYFLYFTLPKKDTKWYEDTVRNFETWCKTEECVEKIKRKNPLNYKCYIYCKNRLNEEN